MASAGAINLFRCPDSKFWRAGISVVIVLGTMVGSSV